MKFFCVFFIILFSFSHCQNNDSLQSYTEVEKQAIFPKGNAEFRDMISRNFRMEKMGEIQNNVHCDLTFTIEKDGTISNIKATGNNDLFNEEAIYAISQIKEKWIPATVNGETVRYRYRVPLDLRFDAEDEKPTFPYGTDNIKKMVYQNLRKSKIKGVNAICTISFNVEVSGKMSEIKAVGESITFNKEVERAVSKVKVKWIPAYKKGVTTRDKVQVQFEFPEK